MLKLMDIKKSFKLGNNEIKILKGINLHIKRGEFVAIIGQSGSGKSTLMNIIGCLDTPSSGIYKVDDKDVSNLSLDELAMLRGKKFGFVFQRYNLISSFNALENVELPAIYIGISKENREKRAKELLSSLELSTKFQNHPNELSGGQQQRVSIARALMNGGEIILADEPTGALDSKSGLIVMDIIKNLHKLGHTIVLVTHDLNIANYANRIIEIKDGEILSDTIKDNSTYKLKTQKFQNKSKFNLIKDQFIESFKMSLNAIFSHKLRAFLTMLGIIIGISSVICVVALGKGSQERILSSIKSIGTNTISIYPGKNFGDLKSNKVKTLTINDSNFLSKQPYLDYATPNAITSGMLTYKNINSKAQIRGGGVHSLSINGIKIQDGRNFNKDDIGQSKSVVIIDQNTLDTFFKNQNPINKVILFNKIPFKIIGVASKDDSAFGSSDQLRIYAPYSAVINKITGDRHISSITAKIPDNINAQLAERNIIEILTKRHKKKDFFTRNSDTLKQTIESTMATMRLLIFSIAFISLVVGGIGVMNIMLVSVTERTKEIGIRMAIGAKQSNILEQFLIEAIILCFIGGILGLSLAYIFGFIFNKISSDFVMIFEIYPAIIALIASSMIGIIFGFIPAKNASKLNPIEALSKE